MADPSAPRSVLQLPAVLESVRSRALQRLGDLLRGMLDRANTALLEWAAEATEERQRACMLAAQQLRQGRSGVDAAFRQVLAEQFVALTSSGRDKPLSFALDQLALVHEDDMEQDFAITRMVARSRQQLGAQLGLLNRRFAEALGRSEINERQQPLDPAQLAGAFKVGLETLELPLDSRLILLEAFEKLLLPDLKVVVDDANQCLVDAGVLPQMKVAAAAPKLAPAAGRVGSDDIAPDRDDKPARERRAFTAEQTEDMLASIHDLIGTLGAGLERLPSGADLASLIQANAALANLPAAMAQGSVVQVPLAPMDIPIGAVVEQVNTAELLARLDRLQQLQPDRRLADDDAAPTPTEVREAIRGQLHQDDTEVETVRQADEDVINLVSMMFDFILDDDNLPMPMKALIARLQIPLLKVAILDRRFFRAEDHPARRLLNVLAKAGLGWSSKDVQGDALYEKIEQVVHTILNEFIDDLSLFDTLLADFERFCGQQNQRSEAVERRTRETEEGRARAELARAMVQQTLNRRLSGRHLPLVVLRVVQDAWRTVLYHTCLKQGTESEPWRQAVKVVDAIIWSVSPASADWRARMPELAPRLLGSLRKGLSLVHFDPMVMEQLLSELARVHEELLRGQEGRRVAVVTAGESSSAHAVSAEQLDSVSEDVDTVVLLAADVPETLAEDAMDEWADVLRRLNVGSWVEFAAAGGMERQKLVARIRAMDKYVFANRRGIKTRELSGAGLLAEVRAGRARVVLEEAVFDRALETVIGGMRRLSQASSIMTV